MSKTFKKLFVGDTVATSGTKVFKKLTTEQSQDSKIKGTWIIKDGFENDGYLNESQIYYVDGAFYGVVNNNDALGTLVLKSIEYMGDRIALCDIELPNLTYPYSYTNYINHNDSININAWYWTSDGSSCPGIENTEQTRTFTVTSTNAYDSEGNDVTETLYTILSNIAVKQ